MDRFFVILLACVIIAAIFGVEKIAANQRKKQQKNESNEAYAARMQQLKKEKVADEEFHQNHPSSGWTIVGGLVIALGVFVCIWGALLFYQGGHATESIQALAGLSYFGTFIQIGVLLVIAGGVFCGVGEAVKLNKRQAFFVERSLLTQKSELPVKKQMPAADQTAAQ